MSTLNATVTLDFGSLAAHKKCAKKRNAPARRNTSKSRDIVPDPFAGSGSTVIAGEGLGRQARLVELDPRDVGVICRRWQAWSGQ